MKGSFDAQISKGRWQAIAPIFWILLLSWLVFFDRLGSTGLLDETEPLFVEAARQMTVTGNWITPYFNEVTRFDKPPLIYWLMAISFKTIGVNEWAARLPSALAGTLLTAFCFHILNVHTTHKPNEPHPSSLIPPRAAEQSSPSSFIPHPSSLIPYLGSAICALNLQSFFFGRLGYSDMVLSVCFGGSLFAFFLGYLRVDRPQLQARFYTAFYILMALAVLTKGPVGIVLPGAIVLLFLICVGKLREGLRELKLLPGMLIFLAVSLPWYVAAYLQNGAVFIDSFFGVHNVDRFTRVVNQHQGPWYFHLLIVLAGFFPWSIYLPAAMGHFVRQNWRQKPRSQHLGLFALIWFSVVLGFFTIAVTKYITYTLPLVPAGAILVALWWNDQRQTQSKSWAFKISVYVSLALCLTLAVCAFYSPNWLDGDPLMPNLGERIRQARLDWIGLVIWLGGAIAGTILILQHRIQRFWSVHLVTYAAFILLFVTPVFGVIDLERQLPLRKVAEAVVQIRQNDEPIVMATTSFEKPSLVFYTQEPIVFLNRARKLPPYLEELRQKTLQSVLVITTSETLQKAEISPQQYKMLKQVGVYQIIRFSGR